MTEIVTASTSADFLALLPRIVGFRPTDSLVVALFTGTRTSGAIRMDLPPDTPVGERRLADYVARTAAALPGVDGVGLVVYTSASFGIDPRIPFLRLSRALERRMLRAGLTIVQLLCVAADGWGRYDEDPASEPRSLHELELSPLDPGELPAFDRGDLPAVSDLELRAFDLSLWSVLEAGDLPDPAAHLELCLSRPPDSRELAQLACLLTSAATRDELMIRAAFGSLVGDITEERNAHLAALQRERGGSMDEVVRAEIEAGRLSLDDEIDGLLIGRGRIRPDPDRIERIRAVLRDLVVRLEGRESSNPLCMLIWLSWARGHGTAAGRYLDLAREIDPRHGMTTILGSLLDRVPFPEWAHLPPEAVPA